MINQFLDFWNATVFGTENFPINFFVHLKTNFKIQ